MQSFTKLVMNSLAKTESAITELLMNRLNKTLSTITELNMNRLDRTQSAIAVLLIHRLDKTQSTITELIMNRLSKTQSAITELLINRLDKTQSSIFISLLLNDLSSQNMFTHIGASLGGSVGCAVQLETRRSRVQPPLMSATFFRGDWSWNIFYGHSLPSADSRRAVVSFWRKNVHNTGEPLRGLSKRVVR